MVRTEMWRKIDSDRGRWSKNAEPLQTSFEQDHFAEEPEEPLARHPPLTELELCVHITDPSFLPQ